MAETFRKNKIEKLIKNLETKKQVYKESVEYWNNNSHLDLDKELLNTRLIKIELVDEILSDICKEFNLS